MEMLLEFSSCRWACSGRRPQGSFHPAWLSRALPFHALAVQCSQSASAESMGRDTATYLRMAQGLNSPPEVGLRPEMASEQYGADGTLAPWLSHQR